MKFQRTTRYFKGQLDLAPILTVLFPLAFFGFFHHWIVLSPGTRLELPTGDATPGLQPGEPAHIVAIDAHRRLWFENQHITLTALGERLKSLSLHAAAPKTLLVLPHQDVPYRHLSELARVARNAGIQTTIWGASPDASTPTSQPSSPPSPPPNTPKKSP